MLSIIEKALFIKKVKLFEAMNASQLKVISNICSEIQIGANQVLFEENDLCDYLYIIVEGKIEIVKRLGQPGEEVLASLSPHATFGEMAFFGDEHRSASARAVEETLLLGIEKEHFLELIREEPHLSIEIIRALAEIIRHQNEMRIKAMKANP